MNSRDEDRIVREAREKAERVSKDDRLDFSDWFCETCKDGKVYSLAEMLTHLKEVHGIDGKTTSATKHMTMHLDGRKWFQTNYAVNIADVKLTNAVRSRRSKNDPMGY